MGTTTSQGGNQIQALIAELAEQHARVLEINARIARETQLLTETQLRMIAALSRTAAAVSTPPVLPPTAPAALRMLRIDEVVRRVGLTRSSLWRMAKEGSFPAPRRISLHAIGWLEPEIEEWLRARQFVYKQDTPQPRPRRR